MNVLDLFSGIGGFSLGLERAGMRTVAFCEIAPYQRAVLRKHWPDIPCYDDVRTITADRLAADGISVDAICGGFPCQDISFAGRGAGLEGERSGLWREYARLIGEFRPQIIIVENVYALLRRGFDVVLGDLAALGYDAEWHCIPAAAAGAPHIRDRIWIIAYPQHPDADRKRPHRAPIDINRSAEFRDEQVGEPGPFRPTMADADQPRLQGRLGEILRQRSAERVAWQGSALGNPSRELSYGSGPEPEQAGWREPANPGWWLVEPDVGRVANGVPSRVDRLKSLGNAVVPQIPEIIGRAIMKSFVSPAECQKPERQP